MLFPACGSKTAEQTGLKPLPKIQVSLSSKARNLSHANKSEQHRTQERGCKCNNLAGLGGSVVVQPERQRHLSTRFPYLYSPAGKAWLLWAVIGSQMILQQLHQQMKEGFLLGRSQRTCPCRFRHIPPQLMSSDPKYALKRLLLKLRFCNTLRSIQLPQEAQRQQASKNLQRRVGQHHTQPPHPRVRLLQGACSILTTRRPGSPTVTDRLSNQGWKSVSGFLKVGAQQNISRVALKAKPAKLNKIHLDR